MPPGWRSRAASRQLQGYGALLRDGGVRLVRAGEQWSEAEAEHGQARKGKADVRRGRESARGGEDDGDAHPSDALGAQAPS